MYRVSREIDFCYGHRLLNYEGKCRYLHGHNGRAVITIEAPSLDHRGMVLDFSDIKKVVATWIDDNLDESCYEWARGRQEPTLLVPTEPDRGLEEAQTEALIGWARGLERERDEPR